MEADRKSSKGGFFNLFDWNGKSRKKLFSNNSESPEGSKQGKENTESKAMLRPDVVEVDDRRANSSNRGSSDFSCASSVASDEAYGSKAPGVVARLMGLDSLPTSSVAEPPSSAPLFDSGLLRASKYDVSSANLWSEYDHMECLKIRNKQEKYSWNPEESRLHKVQNRPIDRFQTEALPPKSAKSIPITHHKLLSPIKTPAFVPTKNVAYIMEAAAKIIEASPRATTSSKVPFIGTSSVPLRIRDLKQKMEAEHTESRPLRSRKTCVTKNTKQLRSDRRQGGSDGKSEGFEKGISSSLKNKGKPVPLAAQAKANAQRGERSTSRSNNILKQKDQNEFKSNQSLKRQPDIHNTILRRTSESRMNNVLRQNNRKQNCAFNKDGASSQNSVSEQQCRKTQSLSGSIRQSRTVNKVAARPEIMSRKVGLVSMHSEKEKTRSTPQKKQCVNGDLQNIGSVSHNTSLDKDDRSIKCNVTIDSSMNLASDNRKTGMDVVSFTFTSPIKKATPDPQLSDQLMREFNTSATDSFRSKDDLHFKKSFSYLPGLNVIGGDALGVLLERKLKELANKVDSSDCNMVGEMSTNSTSSFKNSSSMLNVISSTNAAQDRMFHLARGKDKAECLEDLDCLSVEDSQFAVNQNFQLLEYIEEHSSSSHYSETGKECEYQLPSPVSILEPSFASRSSSNTNGSKYCSPAQAEEVFSGISANESLEVDSEAESSDSACSISTIDVVRKDITRTTTSTEFQEVSDWEIDYVKDILNSVEPSFKDFALGEAPSVITPNLFHQLENQENGTHRDDEECSKLGRKVLFDCVSECMDLKCGQILVGSCDGWAKLGMLFEGKGWLAEELYKVILGWKSMGDLKVDELVDKDMSTHYGRWVDFNMEAFEEGVEIGKGILTSLVDELVSDLLLL